MLQLVYVSTAVGAVDIRPILTDSRRTNVRDGVTGLLYADGVRFLQALEGPAEPVRAAYARIRADPRHRAIVILSERTIETREFGPWDMAHKRPGELDAGFMQRVSSLLANASPNIRGTFDGFAQVRRAA